MPEKAALIADRPLCVLCLSDKNATQVDEVPSYLRHVERVIMLNRGTDRCRAHNG